MPLYEYKCRGCGTVREVRHGFKESFNEPCAECGAEMARVFSPAGIVFKGSGFYVTDSRKTSTSDGAASKDSESKPTDKTAETKASEVKAPETKSSGESTSPSSSEKGSSEKASAPKSEATKSGPKSDAAA